MKRISFSVIVLLFLTAAVASAAPSAGTHVVPTHPRLQFRKDDLFRLRTECLTTHAREYAKLKADADRSVFLGRKPVAPGLLYQMTGESRYLTWAESDYDAFHEALDPKRRRQLADDILYTHRRRMGLNGSPGIGDIRYMTRFGSRSQILSIYGDDVPLALPGELDERLQILAKAFDEARQVYAAISHRRGGKNTSFHCACFLDSAPEFYEKWRIATGEDNFGDTLMTGLILQAVHSTLPLDHACASMTNSWGHDHVGRPAHYLLASRSRDGLCQWIINNPTWVTARDVGTFDPDDFDGLGRAWDKATKNLGGYKEHSGTLPVAWWTGHMPLRILWHDATVKEVPVNTLPRSALFEGLGMSCMRSAWADDAVFARLHSGPNFRGEPPHLNDNTFVIYHKGWLVKPERSTSVLTSHANSILVKDPDETIVIAHSTGGLWPDGLWNGEVVGHKKSKENDGGQSFWRTHVGHLNTKARGKISAYQNTDHFTYTVGDATMSYNPAKLDRFTRQFLYVEPGLFLVFDRVIGRKAAFEKRWVVHTKGEPHLMEGGKTFYADSFDTVRGRRGWERVPGFEPPVNEKEPVVKTTLDFETKYDGVELSLVHKTGPEFGKVTWTLDGGVKLGAIDQHSEEANPRVETVLLRDIPRGNHKLVLQWATGKLNYSFFAVRLGGRVFVTTLLPEGARREVVANANAKKDRFSSRSDYRTDIIASEARHDEVFLHVIEATDRTQAKPVDVVHTGDKQKDVLHFTYNRKKYEVTLARIGAAGGHVRVTAMDGKVLHNGELPPGIVDSDDEHIVRCRKLIEGRTAHRYDYPVAEIAHLTPKVDSAELAKALNDKRWYVRFYAVRALSARKEGADALVGVLKDDDPRVVSAAIEALGRMGAKQATGSLLALLDSPEAEVRRAAAWALGELKAREAKVATALVRRLDDSNDFVSAASADALGKMGNARSIDALAAQLAKSPASHMKASSLWAIAAIGGDEARRKLGAHLNSEDGTIRACAIAGIVKLDGKKALPMLKKLYADEDALVREFAARKLAEFGDPSFLAGFVKTATNTEAKFADRAAALDAIGRMKYRAALQDIVELLDDQGSYPWPHRSDSMSTHAALALHRLGDARGIEFLESALMAGADREKRHVAMGAAQALGKVERKLALPILMKGLGVRKTAATPQMVNSLWAVNRTDPGGDLGGVGWRRPLEDAKRWKAWWAARQAPDKR